jgi:hypothetical protein
VSMAHAHRFPKVPISGLNYLLRDVHNCHVSQNKFSLAVVGRIFFQKELRVDFFSFNIINY